MSWFYIVNELNKGASDEMEVLRKALPQEGVVAKKLTIKPVFIGKPRFGYVINRAEAVVVPEYCIVVGASNMLGRLKVIYTMPIDVARTAKTFTVSVPLNPISPGVYMEETLVQVTVPIEKEAES